MIIIQNLHSGAKLSGWLRHCVQTKDLSDLQLLCLANHNAFTHTVTTMSAVN